jgi:phenol/toluene 2-monooxygenase (NADH) P1/A1
VQYELRTQVVEAKRKTFQHLIERYGDRPASRYEEGSIGLQPMENFHYRPLWAPTHEIYDDSWSRLKLTDPDGFTDPRQYYYAPYVTARAHLHEAFSETLKYLSSRDLLDRLPEAWKAVLAEVVIPLRHYESGAQMISTYGCRFAFGTTVEQCLSYAAFDRVGVAQMLSRVGIALDGGADTLLVTAKATWTDAPAMQPLRRLTEELLVESDWAVSIIGVDIVDQLTYSLLYQHLDEAALMGGAGGYSLIAQHFSTWFADHRRWISALLKAWVDDPENGSANAAVIAETVDRLLPLALAAVRNLAVTADSHLDAGCVTAVEATAAELRANFDALLPATQAQEA